MVSRGWSSARGFARCQPHRVLPSPPITTPSDLPESSPPPPPSTLPRRLPAFRVRFVGRPEVPPGGGGRGAITLGGPRPAHQGGRGINSKVALFSRPVPAPGRAGATPSRLPYRTSDTGSLADQRLPEPQSVGPAVGGHHQSAGAG